MSTVLTIAITVSDLILLQIRLGGRTVEAMKALAAADSGLERTLYADFKITPSVSSGTTISSNQTPFTAVSYRFDVLVTKGGVCSNNPLQACTFDADCLPTPPNICVISATTLRSTGKFGTTSRVVQSSY